VSTAGESPALRPATRAEWELCGAVIRTAKQWHRDPCTWSREPIVPGDEFYAHKHGYTHARHLVAAEDECSHCEGTGRVTLVWAPTPPWQRERLGWPPPEMTAPGAEAQAAGGEGG
jgi:hypothetical protein